MAHNTIVALGGGRFDDGEVFPIVEKTVALSGRESPKMLYLPTAGFDDMSDAQPILDGFKKFGCETDFLLLTDRTQGFERISSAILGADIIFVGGGNLRFLMDTFKSTGADKLLSEAYQRGTVLSGSSSGAMCWFTKGWDDCGENREFVFVECMGILPHCFCPHFQGEDWHRFTEVVHESGMCGIGTENGAALVYRDGVFSSMCGNDGGDVYFMDKNNSFNCVMLDRQCSELNREDN